MANNAMNHGRDNNFGFLRLVMAVLVILAHSPILVDGNRSREILTRLFGTITLGDMAVDGFFLISGYLIVKSFMNSNSYIEYLWKRALRIYPGFIVASLVSLLIGGLAGGKYGGVAQIPGDILRAFALHPPRFDGAFAGNLIPAVNGSMWTVSYEFRCYFVVVLLGYLGVLKSRRVYLILTTIFLIAMVSKIDFSSSPHIVALLGQTRDNIRFKSIFFVGGCAHLYRDRILYTRKVAVICGVVLSLLMFSSRFSEAALAILGGYILFWFALRVRVRSMSKIGTKIDLSYGIYLYAWPIQSWIIWHFRTISPWWLFVITAIVASVFAFASWTFVEAPFLKMKGWIVRRGCEVRKQMVEAS